MSKFDNDLLTTMLTLPESNFTHATVLGEKDEDKTRFIETAFMEVMIATRGTGESVEIIYTDTNHNAARQRFYDLSVQLGVPHSGDKEMKDYLHGVHVFFGEPNEVLSRIENSSSKYVFIADGAYNPLLETQLDSGKLEKRVIRVGPRNESSIGHRDDGVLFKVYNTQPLVDGDYTAKVVSTLDTTILKVKLY